MSKLKPCPFCGRRDVKIKKGIASMNMILCECGAIVSFYKNEDYEKAVKKWNGRKK